VTLDQTNLEIKIYTQDANDIGEHNLQIVASVAETEINTAQKFTIYITQVTNNAPFWQSSLEN